MAKIYKRKNINNNNYLNSERKLLEELFSSIIEYNNYENLLMNKLKENNRYNNQILKGYLVEKNWFLKWKKCTDYDNNKSLLSDLIENKDKIKNNIKINKPDLYPISIIKYLSKNNFSTILKSDIFILVSEKFVSIFESNIPSLKIHKISFKIKNHKLIFFEQSGLYSFNNILPIESNEFFKITNNLIELYIFQEQLKLRIKH